MNRLRLILDRILRRPVVTGPYRLYVRPVPAGAMLDVEHYLDSMLITIADNEDLLGLLLEIAEDRGQAREHDGWEPEALLVEKLKSALGYDIPLYGPASARLEKQLRGAALLTGWREWLRSSRPSAPVVPLPAQRREGGAAA